MGNLYNTGRIFFGLAIADLGVQTIYEHDFPYMVIPPEHSWIPGLLVYVSGALLILAGASIVFEKQIRPISLGLGSVLLLIFCFYFVPYELIASSNYTEFGEWENAAKELALSSGAFVMAGHFSEKNEGTLIRFLGKLVPFGAILFSITIISFGIDHFLYAKAVADYVPSWVPFPLFWTYLAGAGLIGSGLAVILKFKPGLCASLLGTMIFTWIIILHIPRVIASPSADRGSEVASAFLALAYSGIAFAIAGQQRKV